ncbi:hypothetical protein I317_02537 [Kwoniella heveanensis CBS 569]|nr:hypothetical protein I317_02537 [Kwoniella heveanensis CBS 569]
MGLFSRRSRNNTLSSSSSVHLSSPSPNFPASSGSTSTHHSGTSSRSGRLTPLSLSPNIDNSGNTGQPSIHLRVAIDPIPIRGHNEDAKSLFFIHVSPEEGIAALRREIARTVGHGSMGLFKVSIPHQAHAQSRTYTTHYGKSVDLLSQFPAFNLDDPAQLGISLDSTWKEMAVEAVASGADLKVKHWFPEQPVGASDVIHIIARPLMGMPINTVPLTLRAYFAQPPQASSSAGSSSRSLSLPPPITIDVNPYTTVDELKSELLKASGRDENLWKHVVLWQIAMTENEMNVINELGRLKNGKMPWPYPPGAMEPIAMTDGNLPVSLFFPKSAPSGDMLNLSVWLDPAPDVYASANGTDTAPVARDIPHFRYPMLHLERPASTHDQSPPSSQATLTPPLSAVSRVGELEGAATQHLKVKHRGGRIRPSTAPAVVVSDSAIPSIRAFGAGSRPPPPNSSRSARAALPTSSCSIPAFTSSSSTTTVKPQPPKGLGIVTSSAYLPPPPLDRASFSSTISSEDEGSVPSLNFSQQSFDQVAFAAVKTPDAEKQEWIANPIAEGLEMGMKRTVSERRGKVGSLRDRIRKVAAGSPMM